MPLPLLQLNPSLIDNATDDIKKAYKTFWNHIKKIWASNDVEQYKFMKKWIINSVT